MALQAYYVTVVEDRPILSAEYRFPLLAKTDPPCRDLSAIAELLVFVLMRSQLYIKSVILWSGQLAAATPGPLRVSLSQ